MIFNSIDFGLFFLLAFFLYWIFFKKNILARNIFLLTISYVFYGWWDWRFLSLIAISSGIDYLAGLKIHQEEDKKKRKLWLILSLVVNIGFLAFFKYFNFFAESFVEAFSLFGSEFDYQRMSIILPVGISFYTFQTLSYTLDIYYKRLEPTKNVFAFFAFVSFFPQLVAGPIERAKDLLPQFYTQRLIDYEKLRSGLFLMAWGFLKKIVIADRLAIYVDGSYENLEQLDPISSLFAILFFAFQLYLDFSAYSDIAIGAARMFGFDLSTNFKRPYLSTSFSDFWKRWHISLSSWFRDYVYIPLGGNRNGNGKHIRNILIVFILSGLWHGASWNFVIWGALNGAFLLIFDSIFRKKEDRSFVQKFFISLFVTSLWTLSLVFFRSPTFNDAIAMFSNLGGTGQDMLYENGLNSLEFNFVLKLLGALVVIELIQEKYKDLYTWFTARNFIIRWAVYLSIIAMIIFYGSYGVGLNDNNFIYFQF